jgi:hypothetical protein
LATGGTPTVAAASDSEAASTISTRMNRRSRRWTVLVGPLIKSTRNVASVVVRYAFFVELGTGLVFSAISGVRVEGLCLAKCVAATLVAAGFLGYLALVKPAAERLDHWFAVLFAALQLGTSVLVTAAVINDGTNAESTSSGFLDAAQSVSLVTLVCLVIQALAALRRAHRQRCVGQSSSPLPYVNQSPSDVQAPLLSQPTSAVVGTTGTQPVASPDKTKYVSLNHVPDYDRGLVGARVNPLRQLGKDTEAQL